MLSKERTKWNYPVDDLSLRMQFGNKAKEIADFLANSDHRNEDLGLHSGLAGISLFLFYSSRFFSNTHYEKTASNILEDLLREENVARLQRYPTLCTGLSGVAWTISHLQSQNFIDPKEKLIDPIIDSYLQRSMISFMQGGNYDFLHGANGIAVYLIDRIDEDHTYRLALERFVDELEVHAVPFLNGNGAGWRSIIDYESGRTGFNLSLSHGISSIIIVLTKLLKINIQPIKVRNLLDRSINFLLSTKFQTKEESVFPSFIDPNETPTTSRVAWCYGDLGIATALWNAGIELSDDNLQSLALSLFQSCAERNPEKTRIIDPGICHGAFGVAHMYSRVYNITDNGKFKNAAQFWYSTGLKMGKFPDGYAGFKGFFKKEWSPRENFLEGVAGIGMCLLSAIDDQEPTWDRSLLLS